MKAGSILCWEEKFNGVIPKSLGLECQYLIESAEIILVHESSQRPASNYLHRDIY